MGIKMLRVTAHKIGQKETKLNDEGCVLVTRKKKERGSQSRK